MNLLQMSFTGAVMILAVTVIRALGNHTGAADDTVFFALLV